MTKIFSKIDPDKLLHMIVRKEDIKEGRTNLCPTEQFLQCAALRLPQGTTFKAHRHITKPAQYIMPEESWYIVSGDVRIFMYDIDGTYIDWEILRAGDCSFTLNGAGHTYEVLSPCDVREYKVGPYLGIESDKIFI